MWRTTSGALCWGECGQALRSSLALFSFWHRLWVEHIALCVRPAAAGRQIQFAMSWTLLAATGGEHVLAEGVTAWEALQ